MNTAKRTLVFVYGTLKRGQPNYYLIEDAKNGFAEFVASCTLLEKYPLVIASRFNIPFLLDAKDVGCNVEGDVFSVDDSMLSVLDDLEEHPTWYIRREKVEGDVFSVDDSMLSVLDDLEEHPTWYIRREVDCRVDSAPDRNRTNTVYRDGDVITVWVYFMPRYRPDLINQPHLSCYDSAGPHGLEYVTRSARAVPAEFESMNIRQFMKKEVSGFPLQ